MIAPSNSISGLLLQVAKDPLALARAAKPASQDLINLPDSLNHELGFSGVKRTVEDARFVGSGLQLEVALSSGQMINLNIEKRLSGGVREVTLNTNGELNDEDANTLKQIFQQLGNAIDNLMSDDSRGNENAFSFTNMSGIKDIEFTAQMHDGDIKQRLEFEKHHTQYGRKEIEAQWTRYHQLTGQKEQHNLALNKDPKEAAMAYGAMDYQWVVDQVKVGMGIIGNQHTGDTAIQNRVSDFFVSAVHGLFSETQNSHRSLQSLGITPADSKQLIGRTIRAITADEVDSNGPSSGLAIKNNEHSSSMSGLQDFQAHFSSKQNHSGGNGAHGQYQLAMEVSQTTHLTQNPDEDSKTQAQFRRVSLTYESQRGREEYEYQWRHDETFINRYKDGLLEKGYVKVEDLQQGVLSNMKSNIEESAHFMQRKEYQPNSNGESVLQHGYLKPKTHTERGYHINRTV